MAALRVAWLTPLGPLSELTAWLSRQWLELSGCSASQQGLFVYAPPLAKRPDSADRSCMHRSGSLWLHRSGSGFGIWFRRARKVWSLVRLLSEGSRRTGRKAERIDRGEQLPALGVLQPQLLGFFLDPLAVVPHLQNIVLDPLSVSPHPQDVVLELFHPPFVLHLALLVAGIPSPVEHRQQ
jgi:hypothetical protein